VEAQAAEMAELRIDSSAQPSGGFWETCYGFVALAPLAAVVWFAVVLFSKSYRKGLSRDDWQTAIGGMVIALIVWVWFLVYYPPSSWLH
jgi:hypothetical protein